MNNTYFSSAYSAQDKEPSVQKFIAGYKAMYNKEPDVFCMQGYNAGLILADAINVQELLTVLNWLRLLLRLKTCLLPVVNDL